MPYVFGVDGGASTCRAVLITDDGRVVFLGKGPGVNYHEVGASQVTSTIRRLFQDALQTAHAHPEECRGIGLGLAGTARDQDKKILTGMFDSIFAKEKYALTSDAEVALISGTLAEFGVIVISGTGSIVYGRNAEGKETRYGGYGPLISDDGSGYRIAVEGLRAVARAHDGLDGSNPIMEPVFSQLNVKTIEELVTWINSPAASREKIASLAPLIIDMAMDNEPSANEILQQQTDLLALGVEAVCKRLGLFERFDVVLSGGVFTNSPKYRQFVQKKIRYLVPGANVITPKLDPVLGAAFFGFSKAGITIDDDILEVIRRTYREQLHAKPSSELTPAPPPQAATEELKPEESQ